MIKQLGRTVSNKRSLFTSIAVMSFIVLASSFVFSPKSFAVSIGDTNEFPNSVTSSFSPNATSFVDEDGTATDPNGVPGISHYYSLSTQSGAGIDNQFNQSAFRSLGFTSIYSSYEVFIPSSLASSPQPVKANITNACTALQDSNGWEDTPNVSSGNTSSVSAYFQLTDTAGGQTAIGTGVHFGLTSNCSNGNSIQLSIPASYFTPDPRYGNGWSTVSVVVQMDTNARYDMKKNFGVNVNNDGAQIFPMSDSPSPTSGGYSSGSTYNSGDADPVGGYSQDAINLNNPSAEYYYSLNGHQPDNWCDKTIVNGNIEPDPGNNTSDCYAGQTTGGFGALNTPIDDTPAQCNYENCAANQSQGNDGSEPNPGYQDNQSGKNTFNFYFSPDCSYTGTQPVFLKWYRGVGSSDDQTTNPAEQFTISSNGNPPMYSFNLANSNGGNGASYFEIPAGILTAGQVYDWQWTNVDKGHGLTVVMPFSEFTSTSSFSASSCTYSLSSQSNVTPANLTNNTDNATFTHTITNNGPEAATYTWTIEGQYRGNNGNVSAWSNNGCAINAGVVRAGDKCPMGSKSVTSAAGESNPYLWTIKYEFPPFPPGAVRGDQYCQRIVYNHAAGPNDGTETPSSNTTCVKYEPPYQNCTGAECKSIATCTTTVAGDGTGGIVLDDGGALKVTITVYDNSPTYAIPGSLNGNPLGAFSGGIAGVNGVPQMGYEAYDHAAPPSFVSPYGPGVVDPYGPDGFSAYGLGTIEPGIPASVTVTLNEPTSFYSALVANFAHVSLGNYNVTSQPCGIGFHTYEPFTLNANAVGTIANGNDEDPDTFNYAAAVGGGPSNITIPNDLQISCVFVTPSACQSPGYPSNESYGPGGTNGWGGYYTLNGHISMAGAQAGDQYCSQVQLAFSTGYIDPQQDVVYPGTPIDKSQCVTVTNKPYFKVFNSNTLAGVCYVTDSPADCATLGGLKGWNTENSADPADQGVGSGSQFISLLVSGAISGVASGQNTGSFSPVDGVSGDPPGTGLSFANSFAGTPDTGEITSGDSNPNLGGDYSGLIQSPVQQPLSLAGDETTMSGSTAYVNNLNGLGTGSKSYIYGSPNNSVQLQLNPGTISTGNNITVYVYGNVEITSNGANSISYAGTGDGSWSVSSTDNTVTSNIPSFTLVATGNISIDPGVTELDGLYEAGVDGSNGTINTCTGADNTGATYSLCANQLEVNGSFVANNIDLQRTYGSLRNSTANENPTSGPSNLSCSNGVYGSNANSPANKSTCAAEYFDLGPEFYLSSPAVEPPNGGAVEWQSYDNLPPIL
jgi:hypothetical protein